jgi:SAM-dependent methyltransferase
MSVKDVFTRIYKNNEWGGESGQYCSGHGSSGYHASLYADVIKKFIRDKEITSVVDLGCGDFTVGHKLQMDNIKYIGIDIVEDLIMRNKDTYENTNILFKCLDIINDELPYADLCLIRQVLQHLSNSQIMAVLKNIKKYKYIIITEHYPSPFVQVIPNKDKPHGSDTRIIDNSAVYLDQSPFNIQGLSLLLEVDAIVNLRKEGEKIKSFLIEN